MNLNPDALTPAFAIPAALTLWALLLGPYIRHYWKNRQMTTTTKKLTVGQVAAIFGVERRTVQRWADGGLLDHTMTIGGERRFDPDYIAQKLAGA